MSKLEQVSSVSDWSVRAALLESPHSLQFGTQLDEGSSPTVFIDSEYADRYFFGGNQFDDLEIYRCISFDERQPVVPWQSSGDISLFLERLVDAHSADLNDALSDLREARDEALEDGFPLPSAIAVENATRLLRQMYRILPCRFEVYPTPDGEIAIDAPGGHGQSVILYCKAEGGALCLVNIGGKHRHAGYSHASYLPDNFLRDALAELTFETDK